MTESRKLAAILAFGILQAEPQRFLQRFARLHAVVDQTNVDPSLSGISTYETDIAT